MAPTLDRAIEALARKQHGAFNSTQVHQLGGDRSLASRRVRTGQWLRLDTGVFALPGNPPTMLRQLKAAELAVPGAAISGASAATLHGLPGVRLPTTRVEGIRLTTVAQTLADIATIVRPDELGAAVDAALLGGTTSWADLEEAHQVARERRSPTARPLREVLLGRDPTAAVPESVLESRLCSLLDDPRLPPFIRQARAPWDPDGNEAVDALFPSMRWIVEADGRTWHARVADFERDRRRDHKAQRIGWGTSRFTAADIDRPGYVVETLLAIFGRIASIA
jgi:very-short-patch-repair endonuclease